MSAMDQVLIGDRLLCRNKAVLPVSDRGFLYGDAVYETLRSYGGHPFLLSRHLERLGRSAAALYMSLPWSPETLTARLSRLLEANHIDQGRIRITVTRGEGDLRASLEEMEAPNLIMTADPLIPPSTELYERGVSVEIAGRIRNLPGALDPAVKSGNLLNNLLARFEMKRADTFEVLMPNHRGELSEGSLSNLFIVDKEGRLRTPGEESGILAGITRALVIDLARAEGLDCCETSLGRDELLAASEAFLTASTLELLPISRVDGQTIGNGVAGPVTTLLLERYRERVHQDCSRASGNK